MASSSPASGGGAHEGSVVVGGLQQSGHQFWAVLADGGSLGFQAEVDLEPRRHGIGVSPPPATFACLAGEGKQYLALFAVHVVQVKKPAQVDWADAPLASFPTADG